MIKALTWIELIISVALIASIMLQHRGTGLGGAFAGEANVYRSKRGIEKFLFNSTIVLAILLVASVIVHLYLKLKAVA
jgi:preprotein translocase subunit SecG